MKVTITENDIKNMVFEGVKSIIKENVDLKSGLMNLNSADVKDMFENVFGEDAARDVFSSWGSEMWTKMQKYFDNASPEQQDLFCRALGIDNGLNDDGGFDVGFDDITTNNIMEVVSRVVDRQLMNEEIMVGDEISWGGGTATVTYVDDASVEIETQDGQRLTVYPEDIFIQNPHLRDEF